MNKPTTALQVNLERLKSNILALSNIGKKKDGGIYRMAFTKEDLQARQWLTEKFREAGMETSLDGALNVVGKVNGKSKDKPAILIGSHIDTVPNAGALDGTLGVLTALECVNSLREQGPDLGFPIEVIAFSDEEGRFGGMFGSKSMAGMMTPGYLEASTDLNGVFLKDALDALGYDPYLALSATRNPSSIKCYLELHIEQGPVLDNLGKSIGVVSDITGLFKWQAKLTGMANHAGTTPMNMRNDAFMGLADFAHEIPRIIDENGSENSKMTIGQVQLFPGSPNTVPGKVMFSLDVRDVSEEVMHELHQSARKALSAIARKKDLMFEFEELSWIKPVSCDTGLIKIFENNAKALNLDYLKMPSGAAHDAQMMAAIAPVAMLFVPSKGGVSHSIHEWTDWRDIEAGANLMLNTIFEMTT